MVMHQSLLKLAQSVCRIHALFKCTQVHVVCDNDVLKDDVLKVSMPGEKNNNYGIKKIIACSLKVMVNESGPVL